jgi:hypothetical protein
MSAPQRSIFRARAYERYLNARERAVLPRLVAPRTFLYCWALLALLIGGLVVLWTAQVPVYAEALAVVVQGTPEGRYTREPMALVAFFSAHDQARIHAGQTAFISYQKFDDQLTQPLLQVEPRVSSPAEIGERFGLANVGLIVHEPVVVGVLRFDHTHHGAAGTPDLEHSRYVGAIGQVMVPVAKRRLLSFIPLVGSLFEGEVPL